jgi:iron complex outermembrane receptor protein
VRFNRYGGWETTSGLFGAGDGSVTYSYGSETLVDIEGRYKFKNGFTIAAGADNVFDQYPDREQDPVLDFLGVEHALTSPFGFNGAFYYVRASFEF